MPLNTSNDYVIRVQTAKSLGDEPFVRDLIESWRHHEEKSLRPDRFSLAEPVNRSFEKEGTEAAVTLWLTQSRPLMLKRVRKPKFLADCRWRKDKGLDNRKYPWGCTVWLDRNAGDRLAEHLFRFLVEKFHAEVGTLTTDLENQRKHFVKYPTRIGDLEGIAEKFVGLDMIDQLPGIYWRTYLGPDSIQVLEPGSMTGLRPNVIEVFHSGVLLCPYASSDEIGTSEALRAENELTRALGPELFFDRDVWLAKHSITETDHRSRQS